MLKHISCGVLKTALHAETNPNTFIKVFATGTHIASSDSSKHVGDLSNLK